MSGPGLFAAAGVLLAFAAARELNRGRDAGEGLGDRLRDLLAERGRSVAGGALMLGMAERLTRAGLSGRVPVTAMLLGRAGGAAIGLFAAALAAPAAPGRISWLVFIGLPAAGFVAPDALLERAARRRGERLLVALPDVLDLLAVSAASGRSAAAGFAELSASTEGPLAAELGIAVAEISCGRPQDLALGSLRERVGGSAVAALVAAIERSRRHGSPLADQLRRQASALRTDQRRRVEERAARAAPKIQLVVALVLVPSVLLMITAGLIANADVLLGGF
jgi:tight adherence protein C